MPSLQRAYRAVPRERNRLAGGSKCSGTFGFGMLPSGRSRWTAWVIGRQHAVGRFEDFADELLEDVLERDNPEAAKVVGDMTQVAACIPLSRTAALRPDVLLP